MTADEATLTMSYFDMIALTRLQREVDAMIKAGDAVAVTDSNTNVTNDDQDEEESLDEIDEDSTNDEEEEVYNDEDDYFLE